MSSVHRDDGTVPQHRDVHVDRVVLQQDVGMHASEYAAVYEHGMSPVVVARRLVLHGHKDKTIGGFAGKVDAAKN